MKIIILISLILSLNLYARDFAEIKKSGILKIAVDTTYPPMEFEDIDGKVIGFDVDLAYEMAKILNLKTEFIVMPWDGILAGLSSNRYDIIMSSMNITPERSAVVNFVSYMSMGQVFVVRKNTALVKSEKDLTNKIVAVQADTTSYNALMDMKKNKIAIKEIKAFKGATEAFSALKSKQAEVILIDEAVGLYYSGLDSKTFMISGNALKEEPIGIAIPKTSKELFKQIESAMDTMKKNKTYANVYKKWFKVNPK